MAYQKKCYRSTDIHVATGRLKSAVGHQKRGGGTTKRLNSVHKYPTRPLVDTMPDPSPTWLAARRAKKLAVKTVLVKV